MIPQARFAVSGYETGLRVTTDQPARVTEMVEQIAEGRPTRWVLQADIRERDAPLARLARESGVFDVRTTHLRVGDYVVNERIVLERKTYADFALSVIDGRLFRQAAALARQTLRPLVIVEGPRPRRMPDIHPHALKGAVLALAAAWRLPVVFTRDPAESLVALETLARQTERLDCLELPRHGYKPKRLQTRKLYVLQGLPGVGPAIAGRLLDHFGSVQAVMQADEQALAKVRGFGPKKAAAIRRVLQ